MKVLHLSSEATWRGGEQQIAYLIAELKKQGIQPFLPIPNCKISDTNNNLSGS